MLPLMIASLVGPFFVLSAAGALNPRWRVTRATSMRVGVSLFLLGPAVSHFIATEAFVAMLPPWVPARTEIVYVTGVFELLGAIGIWMPRLRRLVGVLLIAMLLCFLPANVYAAFNAGGFGGSTYGPWYLVLRVPFQFFAMWWIAVATEQRWRHRSTGSGATTKQT